MRIYFIFLLFLASLGSLSGQSFPSMPSAIQIGYSGELGFHPGIQIGYEYAAKSWIKTRKNGVSKQKSLIWQGSFSQIWHPETRSFSFVEGGAYLRTLKSSGWTRQLSVRLGGTYIENAGTTYVDQFGSPEGYSYAGRGYATFGIGYGWGYDFRMQKDLPFAVILQPQATLLFAYNQSTLPLIRVELGLRYYLNTKQKS
ncbi:MAG: hypothetical protein AB8H47_25265 [Bacteroidia bacterium]